jgi:hypothetical protein
MTNFTMMSGFQYHGNLKVTQYSPNDVYIYSSFLDGTKHRDRYLKHKPVDLETLLLDLFEPLAEPEAFKSPGNFYYAKIFS